MAGQTVGKENPDLLLDVNVVISAWDLGKHAEILVPPLPPSPSKQQWDSQPDMTLSDDKDYRAVIKVYEKGEVAKNIWGFIDGTFRKTCRPIHGQKQVYSGYKRHHGIKFQGVTTLDGLFAHMFGPMNGNRHATYWRSWHRH